MTSAKKQEIIAKWQDLRLQVLGRLDDDPGWSQEIKYYYTKFTKKEDYSNLSDDDINELWYLSYKFAKVSYPMKHPITNEHDVLRKATNLLISNQDELGQKLKKCQQFLKESTNNNSLQNYGNIIRTMLIINDMRSTIVANKYMDVILTHFGFPKINFSVIESITQGFGNLNTIVDVIEDIEQDYLSRYEDPSGYRIKQIPWKICEILEEHQIVELIREEESRLESSNWSPEEKENIREKFREIAERYSPKITAYIKLHHHRFYDFAINNLNAQFQVLKPNFNNIDLLAQKDNEYYYFEFKPCDTTKLSIREALGQLIEYYYEKSPKAKHLCIVGLENLKKSDKKYLLYLQNMLRNQPFSLSYYWFDEDNQSIKEIEPND